MIQFLALALLQLARPSAAAAIPLVSIVDYPDLPMRGYEVEDRYSGDNFAFFRSVADTLASLKLSDHLGAADAWCVEQGAEDVSDLKVGVGVRALRLRARPRPS